MDGTLVDTEPYWMAAEHALVEAHGGVWTDEHAHQLVGNDLMVSGQLHPRQLADRPVTPRGRPSAARQRGGERPRACAVAPGGP